MKKSIFIFLLYFNCITIYATDDFVEQGEYDCTISTGYPLAFFLIWTKSINNTYVVRLYKSPTNYIDETWTVVDTPFERTSTTKSISTKYKNIQVIQTQSTPTLLDTYPSLWNNPSSNTYPIYPGLISDKSSRYNYIRPYCEYTIEPQIMIRPKSIKIKEKVRVGGVLDDDKVPLLYDIYTEFQATKGFPQDVYVWTFRKNEGSKQNLNAGVKSNNGATLQLKGSNLYASESLFMLAIFNKESITISCDGVTNLFYKPIETCNILTVRPMLTAPTIQSSKTISTSCNGSSDGMIELTLNRTIEEGDEIIFQAKQNGVPIRQTKAVVGTNKVIIEGLKCGLYEVIILNARYNNKKIPGYNYKISGNYYSELAQHKKNYIIVSQPRPISITSTSNTNLTCHNIPTGTISYKVSGGTGDLQTSLIDKANDKVIGSLSGIEGTFEQLPAGNYYLSVTDINNCGPKQSEMITIKQPEPLQLSVRTKKATINNVNNGSFSVLFSGGTAPYNLRWGCTTKCFGNSSTEQYKDFDNAMDDYATINSMMFAGNYDISLSDANACVSNNSFTISQPDSLRMNVISEGTNLCYGDKKVNLNVDTIWGGIKPYTITWNLSANQGSNNSSLEYHTHYLNNLGLGDYRVIVTDSAGASITQSYTITHPDKLELNVSHEDVNCYGDTDGSISMTAIGGTPPYTYYESDKLVEPTIQNVAAGDYELFVKDKNNCKASNIVEILTKSRLTVDVKTKKPSCYYLDNGEAQLYISDGVEPYSVRWLDDNVNDVYYRKDLKAKDYKLVINDALQCAEILQVHIPNADSIDWSVQSQITLCKGQIRTIEVNSNRINTIEWIKNSSIISTEQSCTITDAGNYIVKVNYDEVCESTHNIVVDRIDKEAISEFLVADNVPTNDDIRLVNITSDEYYDKYSWLLPDKNIWVYDEDDRYIDVVFLKAGEYTVGLQTQNGKCISNTYKTINVTDELIKESNNAGFKIEEFKISKSPNTGEFDCYVAFSEVADASLHLYNAVSGKGISTARNLQGLKEYKEYYTLNIETGEYILFLVVPEKNESRYLKFIVR